MFFILNIPADIPAQFFAQPSMSPSTFDVPVPAVIFIVHRFGETFQLSHGFVPMGPLSPIRFRYFALKACLAL